MVWCLLVFELVPLSCSLIVQVHQQMRHHVLWCTCGRPFCLSIWEDEVFHKSLQAFSFFFLSVLQYSVSRERLFCWCAKFHKPRSFAGTSHEIILVMCIFKDITYPPPLLNNQTRKTLQGNLLKLRNSQRSIVAHILKKPEITNNTVLS